MWWILATLLIMLRTDVQAEVYKCPDTRGKFIIQDRPCHGEEPTHPPQEESPPPEEGPPSQTPREISDKSCAFLGSLARNIAILRDRGEPASVYLAKMHDASIKTGGEAGKLWGELTRAIIITVYEKTWWTPEIARQRVEIDCIKQFSH